MFWQEQVAIKYDREVPRFDPEQLDRYNIDRLSCGLIPEASSVLEVGCATGFMSEYLQEVKGCTVIGVEQNPIQAEVARSRCRQIICGNIEDEGVWQAVKEACQSFGGVDVVFASAILEHLRYPDRLLCRANSLLKPTGSVVITLPNIAHWSMRWHLARGRWQYEDYGLLDRTHLRFFTFYTARQLLESCGYRIVHWDIDPISGIPKIGGWIRRSRSLKNSTERPLQWLYRRFPGFFAHQAMFQAVPSGA